MTTKPLDQYDPFLIEVGKLLDPGRWWSEGPGGYVSSMYDSRSFEDRSIAAVKNAEYLLRYLAGAISGDAALPDFFENAINDRVTKAVYAEHEKNEVEINNLLNQIEQLKDMLEAAQEPKASASSFLDLAGDIDLTEDGFQETPFGQNPLMDDLTRAAPLTPRRDIALVDIGPETKSDIPVLEEHPAASKPMPPMLALIGALRRAQYAAEPLGFEVNATVRITPAADKNDSIASFDFTVEAIPGEARVTRETTWLNPDRPTDKYDQVFSIVQSAAKDAGRHTTKLFT